MKPSIAPSNTRIGPPKPLSFSQERFWWSNQMLPGSSDVAISMHLKGEISFAALHETLRILVERHSLLRTRFRLEGASPVQETFAQVEVELPEVDVSSVPDEAREGLLERLMAEASARVLDTTAPPLFRPVLFRVGPLRHSLVIRLSHLLIDERARQILTQEMATVYGALAAGRPFALPRIAPDYTDYALRERTRFAESSLNAHLSFWEKYLAGVPTLLDLPIDHPRPPVRSFRAAWRSTQIPLEVSERFKAFARSAGVTTFQALLAVFFALLSRWASATDIVIGTAATQISDQRYAGVIGPLLNSIAVRADCSGKQSFRSLMQQVRTQLATAIMHVQAPFELVLERLRLERDLSYNPLVQVCFLHRPFVRTVRQWHSLEVTPVEIHETKQPFDLSLGVTEHSAGLTISCSYDTALFEPDTIERFISAYSRLVVAVMEDPLRAVEDYEILSPEERHTQFTVWNDTARVWDSPACLHQAIHRIAEIAPESTAVISNAGQLTYAELSRRAAKLGAHLRSLGTGPDSRVAIVLNRSHELIVAMTAVLEAGGAFLPIDPATPSGRMSYILREARVVCVLTDHGNADRVRETGCPVVEVGAEVAFENNENCSTPVHTTGANLCYVLYTSGSTGEPKGVAVSHDAVMNALQSFAEALRAGPHDTTLAIAPVSFDIAMLEIFVPLITGGRISLVSESGLADGRELIRRMQTDRVTIVQATPVTWRLLLDAGWHPTPGMKILSGAEALPQELARELIGSAGHVWNFYGPTETTIYSSFERMDPANDIVTIGRPMANTSLYVLDRNLQPVPVGVPGATFIAGIGLARGYLNRPSLTARAFVPDPFSSTPGGRMYRTGDVGKLRPDGRIEYQGRSDHQIKLNGRRIELGAISHAINSQPTVSSSVVVRHEGARGACLVAYVVPSGNEAFSRVELRSTLSEQLPSYMIPSAIVEMDRLPKTSRGKIDRKALPAPAELDYQCGAGQAAPRTATEQTVASVWRELLSVETVAADDDFFALGGTSLLVTRVLQMIRAKLGAEISVQAFFDAPTVSALAREVDNALKQSVVSSQFQVESLRRGGEFELAPQQENWWYNEHFAGRIHPNNVHMGFALSGQFHSAAFDQMVAFLWRRHEAFRTAFVARESGGASVLIAAPSAVTPDVQHVDLSQFPEEARTGQLRRISAEEQSRCFDLEQGNLCRIVVIKTDPDTRVIFFTIHHLIFDEWSKGILIKEASQVYSAIVEGKEPRLPALEFQYVDFARWQREWLSSPAGSQQLLYWTRQLAEPLPPLLEQGEEAEFNPLFFNVRGRVVITIGTRATECARKIARAERCTLFSVLLAALKTALYAHSGQTDLRVGTLAANRSVPGAENVVGLFTNVVCIRVRVDPDVSFRKHVRTVHKAIGEVNANQDMPFELVMQEIAKGRTARQPVLQAMLVWLTPPSQSVQFYGLSSSSYREEDESESVVFVRNSLDLRFELIESSEHIDGSITYNTSKFSAADMRALVHTMERSLISTEYGDESIASFCSDIEPHWRSANANCVAV
ncbi:MAG TPA: amino acid adenylation domain-containing protein [Candidatus Dormibacteraeota bacterium]|nr:amino acid adenylation domain-containing protein [Candidatus Dormibacteraeota bacterium]